MEKEKKDKIIELSKIMCNMGFKLDEAIPLMLLSDEEEFMPQLIEWLKNNPKATVDETFEFADTQY